MGSFAANKIISHLVFHKLSPSFQQELVRKLNSSFPTINDILDNYVEIIRTLSLRTQTAPSKEKVFPNSQNKFHHF